MSFPAQLNIDPSPVMPLRGREVAAAAGDMESRPGSQHQASEKLCFIPTSNFQPMTSGGHWLSWRYFYKQLFWLNLQFLEGNSILGAPEGLKLLPPHVGEAAWEQGLAKEYPPPLLLVALMGGNAALAPTHLKRSAKVSHIPQFGSWCRI